MRIFSQEIILKQEITKDYFKKQIGPNEKHFLHFYINYGLFPQESQNYLPEINTFYSNSKSIGYRYKYKISENIAIGCDLIYENWLYSLKQNDNKTFPDSLLHEKENLIINHLGTSPYLRINFSKTGNHISWFMDIAPVFYITLNTKHVVFDKSENENTNYKNSKTIYKQLDYFEKYNYGLIVRFGYSRLVIFGKYRFSDSFTGNYDNIYKLPRFDVGLQLGIY
ncbi:MAG: hypothetical protein JXB17_11255 [Bacteroidales bacterium]|nr:hypothetical protein [Bacteroidales bacterium]